MTKRPISGPPKQTTGKRGLTEPHASKKQARSKPAPALPKTGTAVTPTGRELVRRLWACQGKRAVLTFTASYEDDDGLLDGPVASASSDAQPAPAVIPPAADDVAVALLLGRALPAPAILDRLACGAPVLLLRAADPEAIAERMARFASNGVLSPDRHQPFRNADLRGFFRRTARTAVIILTEEAPKPGRKAERNGPSVLIASALACAAPVIVIASRGKSDLADAASPYAEMDAILPELDPETIRSTLRNVLNVRRVRRLPAGQAKVLTLTDLALAGRPGVSAAQAVRSLERLAAARLGSGEHASSGPRLEELAGYGPARAWGLDLARDLADWKAGRIGWSAVDRGLLLSGPPGTGKTTYAKALARTCGVPLIASSVAQWQQGDGHLGQVLGKMKAVFEEAWAKAPAILFLDELDGIGRRDHLTGEHVEYWEQVVNNILELVDGVCSGEGVVIVGATNHPNRIDPALRRSGRLDRHITIPLPNVPALEQILRSHLSDALAEEDLRGVARQCLGSTGADVAAYVRRAERIARRARRPLAIDDLAAAIAEERPRRPEEARRIEAMHEAGHAIVAMRETGASDITLAIDQPHGGYIAMRGGAGVAFPSKEDLRRHVIMLMAGRAAEEAILGAPSAGSGGSEESDLARATMLALSIETGLGLGDDGGLVWEAQDVALARLGGDPDLRRRISAMLDAAYARAKAVIMAERETVMRLADALMRQSVLEPSEVLAIIDGAEEAKLGNSGPEGPDREAGMKEAVSRQAAKRTEDGKAPGRNLRLRGTSPTSVLIGGDRPAGTRASDQA
ncbi:AAA family ATPase [Aurantimonas sp. 22II-16-19i]|uniref:AAA family ATPase n=1 Tax=Aurantimonas sp. 22II-16-19i TaxID=1317114 RepID=UPI0009F7AF76|nr:AAA family ATPase [Aurantimonas sp. 22II-16-19i]ORE93257.1 ATP-dependent Zn protease [Aurantimonas sp. 22II-16-19i]